MKLQKLVLLLTVFVLMGGNALTAHADDGDGSQACFGDKCVSTSRIAYLGDFCWTYSSAEGDGPLVLGVTHMGGRHFQVSGTLNEGGTDFVIGGFAEYIGSDLVFYLVAPGGMLGYTLPAGEVINVVGTATFSLTLDPFTLEGEGIIMESNSFEEDPTGFTTGLAYGGPFSLTPVECESGNDVGNTFIPSSSWIDSFQN